MTAPLILGFDTSAAHCAAALVRGDTALASVGEDMARGQAERLMGLLEEVLSDNSVTWADLDALAVGTGPGNFTGIRIGVSAARGLALGLNCPAYGVTGFEARALLAPAGTTVAIPAPRDMAYFMDGPGPSLVPACDVAHPAPLPSPADLAAAIAHRAAARWPETPPAPAPFYVRAPDAAPARDAPPPILA
ncbi:tRNA (adenosine(37)-N6)-threonylcarbamoyltransferase complex dimerization subunit type 1 TsaB [Tateyamaria omphalii]|uniref:tRNA (Adenosine(37)-N6)-threonylcarbamoyltransferase complex dimerization subunit type 1 TsaB n=1 Tax=Tateyamaria omphalii TaxID=299262 RepID=A0A1P8MQX2_9RHOB|nr:tRNA (adenosine(37)-N6)-threonylcarbamoyltransferase complex dimerization subunit type 1 TsaB [Tateyamaria omphalii]APX10470.1 tRNA (adenosine(37)-N6)-threonylcarbamoyltransferase complex dimerization subunit type 1 TsaB [Tateyamaria omphalii]